MIISVVFEPVLLSCLSASGAAAVAERSIIWREAQIRLLSSCQLDVMSLLASFPELICGIPVKIRKQFVWMICILGGFPILQLFIPVRTLLNIKVNLMRY